jgi:hypothetical protein
MDGRNHKFPQSFCSGPYWLVKSFATPVEALVRSRARRNLSLSASFCDDTLGYFTERLDPGPTRRGLAVHRCSCQAQQGFR